MHCFIEFNCAFTIITKDNKGTLNSQPKCIPGREIISIALCTSMETAGFIFHKGVSFSNPSFRDVPLLFYHVSFACPVGSAVQTRLSPASLEALQEFLKLYDV